MKVAFIGQKGIPAKSGGVDRHVESLAFYLSQKDTELIVYNRKNYLDENIKEWSGIRLISVPYINTKNLAAITHGFLSVIDALFRKVDIIHFHGIGPCLLAIIPKIFQPKIKVVATLHSFDYGNDKWGFFARTMLKLGERMMSRYADEIIVLTGLMSDHLKKNYNRDSHIIPNGAMIKEAQSAEVLKKFGLEEKKYIVSVSRIIRLKGIQYLINAFNKLKAENRLPKDFKLAIVGDGEYRPELEKLAKNDNDIIFCGNQKDDNLAALYNYSAVFVQSSETEGLSVSLLEAMAYGLPILASDIFANREAADNTAYYFPSKDETNLANKLEMILNNTEESQLMGSKAKRRVEEVYNWTNISNKVYQVYQEVLEK